MTLGQRIAIYRLEQGLSHEMLGEKLSVSRQTISNWELGLEEPSVAALVQLATVLKVSLNELLVSKTPAATQSPQTRHAPTAVQPSKTAKKQNTKHIRVGIVLISIILLLGIFGSLLMFMIMEPGAPLSGTRIELGMTPDEVIAILGEPHDGKVKMNGSYVSYEKFLDYNHIANIYDKSEIQEITDATFYYYNGQLGRTLNRMARLEKRAENVTSMNKFLRMSNKYEKLESRSQNATYTHKLVIKFDKDGVNYINFTAND